MKRAEFTSGTNKSMPKKQKSEHAEPLAYLLDPYEVSRVPRSLHEGVRARPCTRCGRTIVFDGRFGRMPCPWCVAELRR